MKSDRTAIVVHGGAIKGAFAAGVVYGLSKIGVETTDIIVGTSSGNPTCAYFMSRQFESIKDIWTKEVGSKRFVNYLNLFTCKPIFDLRYLIEEIFKKKYPLDVNKIFGAKNMFLMSTFNFKKGRPELFSNKQEETKRYFWKIMQASMTISRAHVDENGPLGDYVDADLDPFSFYRQEVVPKDCNVLLVINHKNIGKTFKKMAGIMIFRILQTMNFPEGAKKQMRMRGKLIDSGMKLFEKFLKEYDPLVISPSSSTKMSPPSVIERDKNKLSYLFEEGVRTVMDMADDPRKGEILRIFISRSDKLSEDQKCLQFSKEKVLP